MSVGKSIILIKMFFIVWRFSFSPPVPGSPSLRPPLKRKRWKRQAGVGNRANTTSTRSVAPCWIFIRSFAFIYTQGLRGPILFAPVHSPYEPLPSPTRFFKRLPPRLETLCRRVWKRKKINERIRMNFINWITRRAPRFDAARTTLLQTRGWLVATAF